MQLQFQAFDDVGGGGEELLVILLAAAEGDVIVSVFAGALVPIVAHALQDFRIVHFAVVILTFMALAFRSVTSAPLENFDAAAPDGAVIGIMGENGAGKGRLLRLAAGWRARRRAPLKHRATSGCWVPTMR